MRSSSMDRLYNDRLGFDCGSRIWKVDQSITTLDDLFKGWKINLDWACLYERLPMDRLSQEDLSVIQFIYTA